MPMLDLSAQSKNCVKFMQMRAFAGMSFKTVHTEAFDTTHVCDLIMISGTYADAGALNILSLISSAGIN